MICFQLHLPRTLRLTLLSLLCALALTAQAEQKEVYGDYEVHYIALPSTILQPDIAQRYQLPVSKAAGFLNISVLKVEEDGSKRPIHAFVTGNVRNDVQQVRDLSFRKVTEQNAVYSIASFWYSPGEIYEFRLNVQADPEKGPFSLRFSQALYPD